MIGQERDQDGDGQFWRRFKVGSHKNSKNLKEFFKTLPGSRRRFTFPRLQRLLRHLGLDVPGRGAVVAHGLDADVDGQRPGEGALAVQQQLHAQVLPVQWFGQLQQIK